MPAGSGVAGTIPFNNAAERAIRPLALGRKNYLFAGSDEGGRRAALIYTLIETARLNDVDPEAWLGDVINRIANHPGGYRCIAARGRHITLTKLPV